MSKPVKVFLFLYVVLLPALANAGNTFFYLAEIKEVYKTEDEIIVDISIPDLISGVTIRYDRENNLPKSCYWTSPRGLMELKIVENLDLPLVFPKTPTPGSIVMIGIDRAKEYINKGKTSFLDVEWHGLLEVPEPD